MMKEKMTNEETLNEKDTNPGLTRGWDWWSENGSFDLENSMEEAEASGDLIRLCRFEGDWSEAMAELDPYASLPGVFHPKYAFARDWASWGYPPTLINFMMDAKPPKRFYDFAEHLNIEHPEVKINAQLPGQITPLHIDNQSAYHTRNQHLGMTKDTPVIRAIIALEDWKWGQYFMMGKSVWHQWKKGDCIAVGDGIPHATANAGKDVRNLLTVTGVRTSKVEELMKTDGAIIKI